MTVTVTRPTVNSIKTRFSEFADVADAVIEFAIEEAALEVGSNWVTGYNIAIVYLTAHYVASAVAESDASSSGGDIASESFGRISISYAQGSTATHTDKESSSYGKRFIELRDRNFGGPVVING